MKRSNTSLAIGSAIALSVLLPARSGWCAKETILATFDDPARALDYLEGKPFIDSQDNVFGTTSGNGLHGAGTVYEVTPHRHLTYLHDFGATDGNPQSGVIADTLGNLYGTTADSEFELAPDGTFVSTQLSYITMGTGGGTAGGLVLESNGNLAGGAYQGQYFDGSSIYTVSSDKAVTVLYTFAGPLAKTGPAYGSLALDLSGNLYGATELGGSYGLGSVYRVTPAGVADVIYTFGPAGGGNCGEVNGGLVLDSAGNIYGTTSDGGNAGNGCVFKLSPTGRLTILHNFVRVQGTYPIGPDGLYPNGGLAIDAERNLYGTTTVGGAYGYGVVFEVHPHGGEKILHSFGGPNDDNVPNYGVSLDLAGNIYGYAVKHTAYTGGVLYKISR